MKKIIAVLLVFLLIFPSVLPVLTQAQANLTVSVTVDKTTAATEDTITYTINYANPDINENLPAGATITVDFTSYLSYIGTDPSLDINSTSAVNNHQIIYTMKALDAGGTGFFKLRAKFPKGTTQNGMQAVLTANSVLANAVTAVVQPTVFTISKTKALPVVNPALGGDVTYKIDIGVNSTGVNAQNVVVTDTLASVTEYVSSTASGVENSGTVTWSVGNLDAGDTKTFYLTVRYNSPGFIVGNTVSNTATITGKDIFDTVIASKSSTVSVTLDDIIAQLYGVSKSSRQGNDEYSIGQDVKYYIDGFGNSGNTQLTNAELNDDIPDSIKLTSVTTGVYDNSTGVMVNIDCQLNNNTTAWHSWGSSSADVNKTFVLNDISSYNNGDFVSKVRWNYSSIPANFRINSSNKIQLTGTLLAAKNAVDNDGNIIIGNPVNILDTIKNTVTWDAMNGSDKISVLPASVNIKVAAAKPWLSVNKYVDKTTAYEGDTIAYRIRLTNNSYATGDLDLTVGGSIDITDVLPTFYTNYSYKPVSTDATVTGSVSETGTDTKIWTLTGYKLKPGQYVELKYSVDVKTPTIANSYGNTATITLNSVDVDARTPGVLSSTVSTYIKFRGKLDSSKLVKGDLDGDFSKFPDSSTLSGGPARYRLTVSNTNSNGPINNIVVIDKLPYVGDTGVVSPQARLTDWRPFVVDANITGKDGGELPPGLQVYYSTVANPDLGQLSNPTNNVNYNTGWSLTPPDDVTTITAFKFVFGNAFSLNNSESAVLEWDMRAPVGTPVDKIAWNSFGYNATYPDSGGVSAFLPSEPIKVGIKVALQTNPLKCSIGDFVWEDMNKNGIQEDSEPGVNNVLVRLYKDADGDGLLNGAEAAPIKTTRTGNDYGTDGTDGKPGHYLFTNLDAGKYIVEIEMPKDSSGNDYYITDHDAVGSTDDKDSDFYSLVSVGAKNYYRTDFITLNAGDNISTVDAGIYRKASIGDLVWYDLNADGIQNDGPNSGVSGITVNLLKKDTNGVYNFATSTTTQSGGNLGKYLFSGLDPGWYKIQVVAPVQYAVSPKDATNDTTDSDIAAGTYTTDETELVSNENDMSWDAGIFKAIIGGYVWDDSNADGLQNSEPAISGVTVKLYDSGNNLIGTTTTGADGRYQFNDLNPDTYHVDVTKKAGYDEFTIQKNNVENDTGDSDAPYTSGNTATISGIHISAGQRDHIHNDVGMYKYCTIGDFVFNDLNHNGLQDTGEPGISGVNVSYSGNTVPDGPVTGSTVTDANGNYQFTGLKPGTYTLTFGTKVDYARTAGNTDTTSTGNDIKDSDATVGGVNDGKTGTYTLKSGDVNNTVDAGLFRGRIGNYVWEDMNYDGIQNEAASNGINGVTVELYKDDVLYGTKSTANDSSNNPGYYYFEDLPSGNYSVKFTAGAAYIPTKKDKGGNDSLDSDMDPIDGTTVSYSLSAGENYLNFDAGFYRYAKIGDYLWEDKNYDGIQNDGATGINGANVNLIDTLDNIVASITTQAHNGSDGWYQFDQVPPGNYKVQFVMPGGFDGFTLQDQGVGPMQDQLDSDVNPTTGKTAVFNIKSADDNQTFDAGVYKFASLGDLVFMDTNLNGLQDINEPGIANVPVQLLDAATSLIVKSTTTDQNGHYNFNQLIPTNYVVKVAPPSGYIITGKDASSNTMDTLDSDIDDVTGKTDSVKLNSGEYNSTLDAGLYLSNKLGDLVWNDLNYNGVQDAGEPGISGITVNLYRNNVLYSTQTTDSNGNYLFTDLPSGTYKIEIVKPAEWNVTLQDATNDSSDNDINLNSLMSGNYSLTQGMNELTVDCGLYKKASLGDYVWLDDNGNGIQDNGEPPVANINVTLTDGKGHTWNTAIDQNGHYNFSNLDPGTSYELTFGLPTGYVTTYKDQGTDDEKDSDVGPDNKISNITLTSGQTRTDLDAGIYSLGSLGDQVWLDSNMNGIQDQGETGFKGAKLTLKDEHGNEWSQTSDNNGNYLFNNLRPGNYTAKVDYPSNYTLTYDKRGSINDADRDQKDSDFNMTSHMTSTILLHSSENITSVDAGLCLIPPANISEIGDYVWNDENMNGIQDSSELGIPGITVDLYYFNTKIMSTVTDASGHYLFSGLSYGQYTVKVDTSKLGEYTQTYDFDGMNDNKATATLQPSERRYDLDFGYAVKKPALSIKKSVDKTEGNPGDTVTYTITVKNTGNIMLHNVMCEDPFLNFKTTVQALAPNESKVFSINYVLPQLKTDSRVIINTASAISDETGKVTDDASVSVIEETTQTSTVQSDSNTKPGTDTGTDIPSEGTTKLTSPQVIIAPPVKGSITIVSQPQHGKAILTGDGGIKYIPDYGYKGKDKVVIKVTGNDGKEVIQEIEISEDAIIKGYISVGASNILLPNSGGMPPELLYLAGFFIAILGMFLSIKLKHKSHGNVHKN